MKLNRTNSALLFLVVIGFYLAYVSSTKISEENQSQIAPKPLSTPAVKMPAALPQATTKEDLAAEYLTTFSAAKPYLNFIGRKITKVKGGYGLFLTHEYFTSSSFASGDEPRIIQTWINENATALHNAKIRRVGLMNKDNWLGACWLEVE